MVGFTELLKRGGNLDREELNRIAHQVMSNTVNEQGEGQDIQILEYIEIVKSAFLRWKNANLQKFQQLQDIEHKDVEMLLDKIHILQRR